jgi:hypothetical protein
MSTREAQTNADPNVQVVTNLHLLRHNCALDTLALTLASVASY